MIHCVILHLTVLLGCLTATAVAGPPVYQQCPDGLTCGKLAPRDLPGMVYDCAYSHPAKGAPVLGNVYYMHGDDGKRSKAMYRQTMLDAAAAGFAGLSCDQRGYSPGASPFVYAEYSYNKLASDILSLTNAAGFNATFGGKFHLVAHDQGARIAWHSIATKLTRDLLLSFSSLAIPHADVFSNNVMGPNAIVTDQTAEQYLRQITLPNSVQVNDNTIFARSCKIFGFDTIDSCQISYWWYNGAIDDGAMALAPLMPFGNDIAAHINISYAMTKALTQYPLEGVPQTVKVGVVSKFPVFFACGVQDNCDLCEQRVLDQTSQLITSKYTSMMNACGHNLIDERPNRCPVAESQKVIDGILANIRSAYE